ncbi:MAG: hypothetical protein ACXW25_09010 [Rhodospirillales bacterium]
MVLPFEDPVARGAVLNQLIEAKVLKEAQARQLERAAQPGAGLAARKLYAELTPMTNEQLNLTAAAPKAARGAATKAYDDGIGQVWVKARELIGDDAYLERYDAGRDDAEMVAAKRAQGDRRHSTAVKVGEAAEAELRQGLDYLAEDGLGYVIWPAVYDGKPVDPEHVREGLRVLRDHALTQLAADAEAEAAADPTRSGALQRTLRNKKIEKLRTDALWLPVGDGRTYALVDPVLRSPLVLAGGQTVLVDLAMVIGAGRKPAASMVTTGGF